MGDASTPEVQVRITATAPPNATRPPSQLAPRILFPDARTQATLPIPMDVVRTIQQAIKPQADKINSLGDVPDFVRVQENLFAASMLDPRYATAAALSAVLNHTSSFGLNFSGSVQEKCKDLGYGDVERIRSAMPWSNPNYRVHAATSSSNDPGFKELLLSMVVGQTTKQSAMARLLTDHAAPLKPSDDILTWFSARLQDVYISGLLGPDSDPDVVLMSLRERLTSSKHELAKLAIEQLANYQSTAEVFTLDGFIHHFQLACAPQLRAWSTPKAPAPARLNAMEDFSDMREHIETLELQLYAMTNKCAYCNKTAHFWKQCLKLAKDTKNGTIKPGWKQRAPGSA